LIPYGSIVDLNGVHNVLKQVIFLTLLLPVSSFAFCGFYVAKADASLFNKASQVILVRNENKTAITMFNDYQGELKDFALVVTVPEILQREQINVGDRSLIERVDAFSAPRLVEYFDTDPCVPPIHLMNMRQAAPTGAVADGEAAAKALGVTIEAKYTIGEYDIVILGAKESTGLETWLKQEGYKLPKSTAKALEPYIKQKMKFFVAKVNLSEQAKTGFVYLRPIQFAFESPKFMLPIRLGMANANGPQDLLIYAVSKKGRVETTNYRTVKLPTGMDLPLSLKPKFADFYRSMFDVAYAKENKKVVFQEYAWNMSWCDPCAAEPLTKAELKKIGVFWFKEERSGPPEKPRMVLPNPGGGGPVEAFITRLHVRYDVENFPEDLFFQETADIENYQGRYVLRHPWTQEASCDKASTYKIQLKERKITEAQTLAQLTGWKMEDILKDVDKDVAEEIKKEKPQKWYESIFK